MGYSNWSDDAFSSRQRKRAATNTTAFTYDADVRRSGKYVVHPQMNPHQITRESRDSAAHPTSLAIGVLFDVTGSMGTVPRVMQTKLGALMRTLVQHGYVEHPQVLFGAIGDAYTDRVPLQIGQFESGLEMDDDLGKIVIEGGGGGQVYESYELGMYFFARHTTIDCYEKRGKKGYLFTIGDENPYDRIRREQVANLIGDTLERDIPIAQVVKELHRTYEHFHIIPTNTSHGRNPAIQQNWQKLLGERVLLLEDENAVTETIALAIALNEGTLDNLYDGVDVLTGAGHDAGAARSAGTALAPYADRRNAAPAGGLIRAVKGLLPGVFGGDDGRL